MAEKTVIEKKVKVLILVDYLDYKSGQVVEVDEVEAKTLVFTGVADDNKGAVGD